MNILFTPSDNWDTSGSFLCMTDLTDILEHKYGHHIIVILPYEGNGNRLLDSKGIKNILVPSYDWIIKIAESRNPKVWKRNLVKFKHNTSAIKKISDIIRKEHIDLVHVNTSWSYVGALAAIKTRTPFIWHIREFLEEDQNKCICFKKCGYRLMRRADIIIAVSESIRKKYVPILGGSKIKIVSDGVNPERYYSPNHKILNGERVNLLMVGSINEGKGQWMAIEACRLLKEKGISDFTLRIVGGCDNEYMALLKEKVDRYGLLSNVKFCGSSIDTEKYYSTADIYLMCSKSEAFGRVTVEAMLGGCLTIGRNSGGTSELIEDGKTGLLFNKDSVDDLADKIEYAMSHREEMRVMANQGQSYMLHHMTAEQNAEKINDIYKELMER